MEGLQLTRIIEAILIATAEPVSSEKLAKIIRGKGVEHQGGGLQLKEVTAAQVTEGIGHLNEDYEMAGRAFSIQQRASGWKIFTLPDYAPFLDHLKPEEKAQKLSQAAVETLAIVAYRQPMTRGQIEAVRGVACDAMLQKLLDLELIKISGRAELPGRPLLYATTPTFFEHFGIKSIEELPNAAELMKVRLPSGE